MRPIPRINILLFVFTLITTVIAGTIQAGRDPFDGPASLLYGLPYAGTLLLILMSHELGHYFASRAHRVDATYPYFIPAPPTFPPFIGTFGAVIKMHSPIPTRRALVDIGASGPIVGFVLSCLAVAVGLGHSEIVAAEGQGLVMKLGDPLIFKAISWAVLGDIPEGYDVMLHPVAFAGWLGFLVTMLNLLPVGQLDGGHVLYAAMRRFHVGIGRGVALGLLLMGYLYWPGWYVWAVMMAVLGFRHPPVYYWEPVLDSKRVVTGATALLIFVLTFTPAPIEVVTR